MHKKHRIFIAINLPEEIKRELVDFQQKFILNNAERCEWAKWTAKDNLHITLEFLGDLTDEELGEVCIAVKGIAKKHASFNLNISKIIYGPEKLKPGQPPKFIWAMGEKSKELANLRQDLEEALVQKVAFIPEERAFAPHITLARIGAFAFRQLEQDEVPEINEGLDLFFTVESIEVMESELKREGPVYTILESEPLGS